MDSHEKIVERIGENLREIGVRQSEPLRSIANVYRQTGESICKAIIYALDPTSVLDAHVSLDKLSAQAVKLLAKTEPKREVDVFAAGIRYLQNLGNAFSHDGESTKLSDSIGQDSPRLVLTYLLRVVFGGPLADFQPPNCPSPFEAAFPARLRDKPLFENPRAHEVVLLCFPKSDVKTRISKADQSTRVAYDYVVANLGGNIRKGFLFLKSRSSLEKSLQDFLLESSGVFPHSLDIITPRVVRTDGREVDRLSSISEVVQKIFPTELLAKANVIYFDDLVWNLCLPSHFREVEAFPMVTEHFVDQQLQETALSGILQDGSLPPYSTSSYLSDVLNDLQNVHPIQVIVGPSGIGKTTFCNTLTSQVNMHDKKRAILISATDFRDISHPSEIKSVRDLYHLALRTGALGEEQSIEAHNFEINLACGNLILVIDGFDELESHLGDMLDVTAFMNSLTELNQSFRKVLVIITVRDYMLERFYKFDHVSVSKLSGFSNSDVEKYLQKRLTGGVIGEAKALLATFHDEASEVQATVPLYAALICDYLEKSPGRSDVSNSWKASNYFLSDKPLDALLLKIIEREIAKQALREIEIDDVFEILVEALKSHQATISKARVREYFDDLGVLDKEAVRKFARGPFFTSQEDGDYFRFKYDSLSALLKARYLYRWIGAGSFVADPMVEFMGECARGDGALFEELCSMLGVAESFSEEKMKEWFKGLIKHLKSNDGKRGRLQGRRAISGFLYLCLNGERNADKSSRSKIIENVFGDQIWDGFSVFGPLFALDFRGTMIRDAYLENYSSLDKCVFPEDEVVFFESEIHFDQNCSPGKLRKECFDTSCRFSENVFGAFDAHAKSSDQEFLVVRDNLYKVLKVGFRGNNFFWKNRAVYRTASLIGQAPQESYLAVLVDCGVLEQQPDKVKRSEVGYIVASSWRGDARRLIEDKNVTDKMVGVINRILGEIA